MLFESKIFIKYSIIYILSNILPWELNILDISYFVFNKVTDLNSLAYFV